MDIEKMNEEFNRLLKKWDVKAIEKWLEEKRLEEEQEKQNKRSEQLFCKCGAIKNTIYQCNRTDCDNTVFYFDAK